jgi:phage shock protein C
MDTMERRLRKSRTDRMIDGVCGGVAAYFSIDSTLVRIAWVLLTLFGGSGVLLYLAAMIIMPKEDAVTAAGEPPKNHTQNTKFWGILLVVVGAFWLMGNLGFPLWHHWWGFPLRIGVPVLLILAGVAFLFGGSSYVMSPGPAAGPGQPDTGSTSQESSTMHYERLYRSRTERKVFGVCGGIGLYAHIDPVIVRLLFVAGVLASCGFFILLYFLMAIIVPKEPESTPAAAA